MTLSASAVISLSALIIYISFLWIVLTRKSGEPIGRHFGLFLFVMALWSFGSFMAYIQLNDLNALFWNRFMMIGSAAAPIAFYSIVQAFLKRNLRAWLWAGFIIFSVVQGFNILGWVVSTAEVTNNTLHTTYGSGILAVDIIWVFFLGLSIALLITRLRKAEAALDRKRCSYLLLAIGIVLIGYLSYGTDLSDYPTNILFNIVAALVVFYALFNSHLLDFSDLVRVGLYYLTPTIIIWLFFFVILTQVSGFAPMVSGAAALALSTLAAIFVMLVAHIIQRKGQSWIEQLFYKERCDSSQMLVKLEQAFNSAPPLEELIETVLNETTSGLHLNSSHMFLVQGESGDYSLMPRESRPGSFKLNRLHPIVTYLKGEAAFLRYSDLEIYPEFKALWKNEKDQLKELGAELFFPLKARTELVGILVVGKKVTEAAFSSLDLQTLFTLAKHMAPVIKNELAFETEDRRRKEAENLQTALGQLTSEIDLEQVLNNILTNLAVAAPYDYACIFLVTGNRVIGAAEKGFPGQESLVGKDFTIESDDLFTEMIQTHQTLLVPDLQTGFQYKRYHSSKFVRSWMGIPLISRGVINGFLTLSSKKPDTYRDIEQASVAFTFASHASIIIENARLFKVEREQRQLADALREIGVVLSTTLDLDNVLDLLLDQIGRVVPYTIANVVLVEGNAIRVVRTRFHENIDYDTAQQLKTSGFSISPVPNLYYMVDTAQPVVISEIPVDANWIESPVPMGSWVGAPVVVKGKVIACFSLAKLEPHFYRNRHGELLAVFAGQAALALQNARFYSEIQRLAIKDELTDTYNHRHFIELGEREFNRAQRYNRPLSLIMYDLDHFKRINDSYGPLIGDQVLRVVAERCKSNVREVDVMGRFGGEEFSILLPEASMVDIQRISERLRRDIAKMPVSTTAGEIEVTISLGAASISEEIASLTKLIECADFAMYKAKQRGRNNFYIFDEASN
jgi:diguanylate cyclase (GGDEF)-like protein